MYIYTCFKGIFGVFSSSIREAEKRMFEKGANKEYAGITGMLPNLHGRTLDIP